MTKDLRHIEALKKCQDNQRSSGQGRACDDFMLKFELMKHLLAGGENSEFAKLQGLVSSYKGHKTFLPRMYEILVAFLVVWSLLQTRMALKVIFTLWPFPFLLHSGPFFMDDSFLTDKGLQKKRPPTEKSWP